MQASESSGTGAQTRAKEGDCDVMSLTAMPVIAAILLIGVKTLEEFTGSPLGTPAPLAVPFIAGSVIDIAIAAWHDFWKDSEEIAWLEAELETIERLVDRFSGFAGVWLEDGDGDEIDIDDLAHPNAPDGGMDCVIVVDGGRYTEKGFQATCTRVINIIRDGDW